MKIKVRYFKEVSMKLNQHESELLHHTVWEYLEMMDDQQRTFTRENREVLEKIIDACSPDPE